MKFVVLSYFVRATSFLMFSFFNIIISAVYHEKIKLLYVAKRNNSHPTISHSMYGSAAYCTQKHKEKNIIVLSY